MEIAIATKWDMEIGIGMMTFPRNGVNWADPIAPIQMSCPE
jgi:hypothetical protein